MHLSVLPYIIDFILITTYPENLNERNKEGKNLKAFWKTSAMQIKTIINNYKIIKIILSGASYDGVFKTIKDYIQPILSVIIFSAGVGTLVNLDDGESFKVYLGVLYGLFYIFSSFASKNIFRVSSRFGAVAVFETMYDLMGLLLIFISLSIKNEYLFTTIILYFVLFLLTDARRPTFLEVSSEHMNKTQRVTVLSIESQLRAMFMMIFAPVFGYIAESISLSFLFLVIGGILLITNRFLRLRGVLLEMKK